MRRANAAAPQATHRAAASPRPNGSLVVSSASSRLIFGASRQAPGEHRLPAPGRSNHQDVVAASGSDLERALRVRLPLHLGEVDVVLGALGEQRDDIDGGARQLGLAVEEIRDFSQAPCAKDLKSVHDAGFRKVLARAGSMPRRQRPAAANATEGLPSRANRTFETELAPADIKRRIGLRLPIALGICATEQINGERWERSLCSASSVSKVRFAP